MKKILSILKLLWGKYELSRYNNYTISEHFRKQGAQIGKECHLGIRKLSSEPYLIKVGDKVLIANGVLLITHSSGWIYRDKDPDLSLYGKIEISNNCYIGANAIILPNVTIGENSIIAAGAVVTSDIPPNSIAGGVPAKIIGNTEDYYHKIKGIWSEQKPLNFMNEIVSDKVYTREKLNKINQLPKNKELLREHLTRYFWGKSF